MKNPFKSKTIWMNVLVALVPLVVPPAQDWIATHPDVATSVIGVLGVALRLLTKEPVSLKTDDGSVRPR